MRVNVAFGILLGFAMLEMLLLQAAMLVDGYAHAITKPAILPSAEHTASFAKKIAGPLPEGYCDVSGWFLCFASSYCFVDHTWVGCCPPGSACLPQRTCVDNNDLSLTQPDIQSSISAGFVLQCNAQEPFCVTTINQALSLTQYGCTGDRDSSFITSDMDATLRDISTWSSVEPETTTVIVTLSRSRSQTLAPSTSHSTAKSSMSSKSGQAGRIVTVIVTQAPTTGTSSSSTSAGTPSPSKDSDNGSSRADTGKKVGIAIGVISICVLAAAGAWFAYRRHLKTRRSNQNAPWQSPSPGPHHHYPEAVELDGVDAERAEMDHSPAPLPEMDPSPRPSELASRELSELPFPPVSPLPVGDRGSPAIGGSRSPVSLLEGHSPVSETAPARDPPTAVSGRYGVGGFLNPEYALRDGLFFAEDDRQVAKSTLF